MEVLVKVLFYYLTPFAFAHGGLQTQVLQTRKALERFGIEVKFLRWWDQSQTGDILHFFGRLSTSNLQLAQGKGMKVVLAELLTEQGSRSNRQLKLQKMARLVVERTLLHRLPLLTWGSYPLADACVALTEWEARLMKTLYGAPPAKVHVVPNGVEEAFLNSQPA